MTPGRSIAGSWKPIDFPKPVGITASKSEPASAASTTSFWPGRKAACPKWRLSAASGLVALIVKSSSRQEETFRAFSEEMFASWSKSLS